VLRIALPNKGRLTEGARDLLERAGLAFEMRERALQASLGENFTAIFVNARDIPEFVADGAADFGITGSDLIAESGRAVDVLLPLKFGGCRLAVAVREDSGIRDIDGVKPGARVATVFPNITRQFFQSIARDITIVPVSGAAEIAPHLGVADIIVDLVSSGSTLRMNGLIEICTVMESEAVLMTRTGATPDAVLGREARELVTALESVLRAQGKRYLMANVPRSALAEIKRVLPGLNGPTIVDVLNGGEMVAAHAVVDSSGIYRTIADLRELGAQGIVVTRIERLMP